MAGLEEKERKRKKEASLMGLALARSLNCAERPQTAPPAAALSLTAAEVPTETRDLSACAVGSPSSTAVSSKISSKYASIVRECEMKRRERLKPLTRHQPVAPIERDLARSLKGELDTVLQKVGMDPDGPHRPDGWDSLEKSEDFQKSIKFLFDHSRAGQHVEEFGGDAKYEGEFMYGMRHGNGRHEFRGEVYDGEWRWDKWHGIGALTSKDGTRTTGGFQEGKPHGHVKVVDPSDKVLYEGEFRNGKRHGLGRQLIAHSDNTGDVYEGSWENGHFHGRGVYFFANGDKMEGTWSNGKYDGACVYHQVDGSRSRRIYALDENGRSKLVSSQDCEGTSQRWAGSQTLSTVAPGGRSAVDALAVATAAMAR